MIPNSFPNYYRITEVTSSYGSTSTFEPTTFELVRHNSANTVNVVHAWTHPAGQKMATSGLSVSLVLGEHYSIRVQSGSVGQGKGFTVTLQLTNINCLV